MKYIILIICLLFIFTACSKAAAPAIPSNTGTNQVNVTEEVEVETASGELDEEVTLTDIIEETSGKPVPYSFYSPDRELINIYPISHATAVIEWGEKTIYIDPAEEKVAYTGLNDPDMIFITHVHGDHLQNPVLKTLQSKSPTIVVPGSVNDQLEGETQIVATIMQSGTSLEIDGFSVSAIPAYNIREDALNFHPKDRKDNGYVLEKDGFRVYFAGDSEDIPEMRALKNIDVAFVPMNLPFTMTVESAASAVLEFAPKTVFPYHYRGRDGKSDVEGFKNLVNADSSEIEVILHDWYSD